MIDFAKGIVANDDSAIKKSASGKIRGVRAGDE